MKRKLFWLTTISLLAVLAFSGTVFAEGEQPPAVPTEEPAAVVVETPPAVVEPAAEVPVVDQTVPEQTVQTDEVIAPVVEAPAAVVEVAPTQPAVETEAITPVVTEDTTAIADPILADASGEPINLASQESADLISNGDPYWFVGSHKYATVFILADCPSGTIANVSCWASPTPINDALNRIESSGIVPTNRKLYVVGGADFSEDIVIDGGNPANLYKSQLNGFLGVADGLGVFPVLDGYIDLNEMDHGFTLSDFTINGYFSIKNSDGAVSIKHVKVHNTTGSGIVIGDETFGVYTRHNGSVTLADVTSNNNTGSGAEIYIDGALSISKSAFNFNGADGLTINALTGTISMKDSTAIGNHVFNANISRFQKTLTIKDSVLNDSENESGLYAFSSNSAPIILDTVVVNNNADYGMYLQSNGPITLTNVDVNNSANTGAYLFHPNGVTPILVTDSNFLSNGLSTSGSGLVVFSRGDVILTTITASENFNDGVYVDNCRLDISECLGSGVVMITSPVNGGLMSANYFNDNGDDGIEIYSNSLVTLSDFVSNDNGVGVYIENRHGNNDVLIITTLPNWTNTADGNAGNGINLWTRGIINVLDTNASGNGGYGFYTTNNPEYTLISTGEFFDNSTGLYISTKSPITLDHVKANGNDHYGMYLVVDDDDQVSLVATEALDNLDNLAGGIYVSTDGDIVFVSVHASGNTGYGALVEGCLDGDCEDTASFSLYGKGNYFDNNDTYGLYVKTFGGIGLSNIGATGNDSYGIQLDNEYTDLTNGVNITNTDAFSIEDNSTIGLQVYTNGTITLTRVQAIDNGTYGALLDNSTADTAKALTLNSCIFEENGTTGIYPGIYADIYGPINAYSLRASYNTGSGAYLKNTHGTVLVTEGDRSLSRFLHNDVNGLEIYSTHSVVVKNFKADLNGNIGILVYSDANVTISGSNTLHATTILQNIVDGLDVFADGTITISGTIQANDNGFNGIYLDNHSAGSPKKISVTNTETNGNGNRGLWIEGNGAVTLTSVESQFNDDNGIYVYNEFGSSGVVTVTGSNLISNNDGYGLEIYTDKAAVLSGVKADLNGYSGIYIESFVGTTKLSNILARMNSDNGVEISAMNNVVLNHVRSLNNGNIITNGDGLLINSNNFDITIENSAFHGNFGNGIDADPGTGDLDINSTSYVGNDASNLGFLDLFVP